MQAAIVVILLSFCASLALPVPVHKINQRREEREISIEELESQLEDIENHIDSVRKKVKEETKENTKNVDTTKGISLTSSTEKFIVSKTEPEGHKTVENLKTTEQFQVFVEKKTPTPTPKTQPINAKTTDVDTVEVEKITPDAETKENVIIKVEKTEEEQEHQNVETPEEVESEFKVEKLPAIKSENGEEETGATFTVEKEEDNEKSAKGFVVEKVTGKIKVQKLTNDETEDEEADLEIGRTAVTTPVKTTKTEFKIEKITSSDKSPAKSEQSEIVVEQVQPKLTIEAKRSLVGNTKTEFKIEKITPSSKSEQSEIVVEQVQPKLTIETEGGQVQQRAEDEDLKVDGTSKSSDGKGKIEVKVEKVSTKEPHHAEGDQRNIVVKVEKISPSTDETDAEDTTPVKTAKTEFKVEKITPSAKSEQSEIVVEQVQPKLTIETKRSQVKTAKTEFKIEKITSSSKSPAKSEESEIVVEQVEPKLTIETERSRVQKIEEDEDLKVDGTSESTDGKGKIEVKVEKVSTKEPPHAEGDQRNIVVKVEKLSPSTDETDAEVTTPVKTAKTEFKVEKITPSSKSEQSEIVVEQVQPKLIIETKRSQVKTAKTEFKIEKITSSSKSPAKSEESEIVVEQVQPKLTIETERSRVQKIEEDEDEDLRVDGTSESTDGKGKIEVKVEKVSTKEPPHAEGDQRNIVVKVEKISPSTDETDAEVTTPVKTAKTEFKVEKITPSSKSEQSEIVVEQVQPKLIIETKRSQVKTAKTEFKIEKITSSSKSPAKSEGSEIVVEQVEPKLTIETERSRVQKIEEDEDEDLKVDGTSESTDGKGKIEVKVEKVSTKEPHHAEGDQRNIVVKVEKISPSNDETDAEVTTPVKTAKTEFKIEKITSSSKSPAKTEESEIVVEQVQPKLTIETKRSRVQKIEEDEDLKVSESSKSTVTGEVPTSKDPVDQISISEEKASPSKRPASVTAQISVVKVVKVTPEEEEDLKHSENKVNLEPVETFLSNGKRSDDATDDSEEEALELELEGGQKSKTDEQKIAEEFDKALEAERNARKENSKTAQSVRPTTPSDAVITATLQQVTTGEKKQTSEDETEKELDNIAVEQNDEAASEKEELKRGMSDEELELNELVQNTMNDDDDKEETKPTEKTTTATSKVVVIKVEKVPKVSMKVTKENNELLLSKKETAKEEKELKDELAHEVEQEKAGALPVIVKVEKLGDIPDTKAANTQDNSEVRPDKEETDTTSEEAEQESELEDETDAKNKRAASITRVVNLENLPIM